MSQHIFETNVADKTYKVQIGWDRPLQQFYGVIFLWLEDANHENDGYWDEDNPVWSNLYFNRDFTLPEIVDVCAKLAIPLPDGLLENVENDKKRDAVNEWQFYPPTNTPS